MNRYFNVLRNAAHLFTRGFWQSVRELRQAQAQAAAQGLHLHILIMLGGLGDIIAADPTIRALVKADEYSVILARPSYLSAFAFTPHIRQAVRTDAYLQALLLRKFFRRARWSNLHVDGHVCNMFRIALRNRNESCITADNYYCQGRTLADVYAQVSLGHNAQTAPQIYPDPGFNMEAYLKAQFSEQRPIIGMHFQATEATRSYSEAQALVVALALQEKLGGNIIEFGLDPVLPESARIKHIGGRITLPQQMAVLEGAALFIGVDSGFSHAATAAAIPSLLFLGRYRHFTNYMPWALYDSDQVIRSVGTLSEIAPEKIIQTALQIFLGTMATSEQGRSR